MHNEQITETGVGKINWTIILLAGLSILLVLRLIALFLNATDLFYDEAQYWSWSTDPDFGYYSKPPLIAWLINASTNVCGLSEFCIRLPSPLLHTATALMVFVLGRYLYDSRVGAIAALIYATLPGVSISAGIISTDVPLLFFWALGLFALAAMFNTKDYWPALLLGVALGLGLNAKYAMAWFIICLATYLIATPSRRFLLKDFRLYSALAMGSAMIVPNILWNLNNKFATFSHTADNANWGRDLFHPIEALEFLGSQFGVFGPILFASLLVISWRACRTELPESDRYLLAFSIPLILIITVQAFLSRAHANWAAVAYIAATVLVTATMVRDLAWPWLKASMGIHLSVLALAILATSLAGKIALPPGADPFARTLGWEEIAIKTREEIQKARKKGEAYSAVLCDRRSISAALLYYMRNEPTPVYAWRGKKSPRDHFELTRAYPKNAPQPVLLVSLFGKKSPALRAFKDARQLATKDINAGLNAKRSVTYFVLKGYKGE